MSEDVLTTDFAGEHERLQLLEAQADPLSVEAIEAAGIGPGSRCLEIAELDDAQILLADPELCYLGPAWVASWGKRPEPPICI